jgi:formylglycine-generating enzyme required for sulfatase activity
MKPLLQRLFYILLLAQVPAFGQDSLNVSMVGWLHDYWDCASETKIVGTIAYCATAYSGLRVVDISDPTMPFEIGSCETPGSALGIAISGNYAYIADERGGLRIIDITNPANPVETGFYDTAGNAYGVAIVGNFAYVADGLSGLRVFNVTNPSSPVQAGVLNTPGLARGVIVEGSFAYVADDTGGLRVIDITNPANMTEVGFFDTPGQAYRMALAGSSIYIADYNYGLRIVDISNAALPVEIGHYDTTGYSYDVKIVGGLAYLADDGSGLRIVDISNPANPILVGSRTTLGTTHGVIIDGTYAYLSDWYNGLRVMDISNPASPHEAGFYDTPGHCLDVTVSGSYAYIADVHAGIRIVDISNPEEPLEVGRCETPDWAFDVAVSGNYAYVADRQSGLRVQNVSVPSAPYEVGFYNTPGESYAVAVSGSLAYIADGPSGLRIVDVSNSSLPVEIGFLDTPGWATDVAIAGNLVYIADSTGGLRIIDVTNPSAPEEVSVYDAAGSIRHVLVRDGYVYMTAGNSGHRDATGLHILNVSDSEQPTIEGFYQTPGNARAIALSGNYAYVSDGWAGVQIIDISDPSQMVEAGHYNRDSGGNSYGVAVSGCYAYLTDYFYFEVLDCSSANGCDEAPVLTSFAIENGDPTTVRRNVSLNHEASNNPIEFRWSEQSDFAGTLWEGYISVPEVMLSEGEGIKTVWLQLRNSSGESNVMSDDIEYSETVPVITAVTINNGDATTANRLVSIAITATYSPTEMMLSEDPSFDEMDWQAFASPASFELSEGNGSKVVYVKARNENGPSESVSDEIVYYSGVPDEVEDLSLLVDQGTNSVLLRWSPVDYAQTYKIYADSVSGVGIGGSTFLYTTPDTFYYDVTGLPLFSARYYTVISSGEPIAIEGMVYIPAGEFVMGSNVVGGSATPEHVVYLDAYYIDIYEVTNGMFREYCDATGYHYLPRPDFENDSVMTHYFTDYPDYPLVGVRWDEACAYCAWLDKRLPTEAEWERAAKGNEDNRLWPWGNTFLQGISGTTRHANVDGIADGWLYTSPAGYYPTGISPTGCYDMAGNCNEHCSDWYAADYYSMSPDSNPQGPETGTARVRRGGAWHYNSTFARCSNRYWLLPAYRGSCSFRCVKEP